MSMAHSALSCFTGGSAGASLSHRAPILIASPMMLDLNTDQYTAKLNPATAQTNEPLRPDLIFTAMEQSSDLPIESVKKIGEVIMTTIDARDASNSRPNMDSDSRAERDAKIYARRIEGLTCKAIAREFGLSPARVWEIAMHMERKAKWRERAIRLGWIN
jgi:DNA-binding CsgD family transcriptional regulator